MTPTYVTTARNALRALTGTSQILDIGTGLKALADDVDVKMASFSEGAHAGRPAAGQPNRFYYEIDTGVLLRDNGTTWDAISWPGRLSFSATLTAPDGWLKAEGQAVSRTAYALLFAAIGTLNGAGDGSTTFNLPDYRERTPVGAGGSLAAGAKGGEATHQLTVGELAAHQHGFTGPSAAAEGKFGTPGGSEYVATRAGSAETTQSTGGGAAHNNMQPYTVCNVLIKT